MTFEPTRLGDLGRVITGRTPPAAKREWFGDVFPFITPTDIQGDVRYVQTGRHLSDAGGAALGRILLPSKSVCVVCIGNTIGKVCMTDQPSFTNQQINSIVVDDTQFDPFFVFAAVRLLQEKLRSRASGAATPIVNKSSFEDIEILVPDYVTQRRIGGILKAYDDLIDVNFRRMSILAEMARRVFLDAVESASEGWSEGVLGDLAVPDGKTTTPMNYADEIFAHFSLPSFDLNGEPSAENGASILSNKLEFKSGSVLVSKLNPRIPRSWLVDRQHSGRMICSTEFVPLRPRDGKSLYVLDQVVRTTGFIGHLSAVAAGTSTSHQRVKLEDILGYRMRVPDDDFLERLEGPLAAFGQLATVLKAQVLRLRASRDLLLPELVLGRLNPGAGAALMEDAA